MPKIKLEHVVSCSTEDPVHVASNLLNTDTSKKWKSKACGESSATIIFQLEKACKISGIDIGNENSSFAEVLVGRSSSQESDYQIILAMSSFMTPMEARNLSNNNRVRLFTYKDLAEPARDEKWDRVKVVCTQPFNKHVQYGLSFITLQTPQETKTEDQVASVSLGKFTLRPESPNFLTAGSLFARRKDLAGQSETRNITVAQEIKKNVATPKCKPINIKSPANKTKPDDTNQKNRNRTDLFYESDDEEANDKIDKVVEKAKQEEEKRRTDAKAKKEEEKRKGIAAKTTPVKTPRKKNTDTNNGKKNSVDDKKDVNCKPSSSNKTLKDVASPSTSKITKRKVDSPAAKTAKKKMKLETKPFCQLMGNIVFTISGIMNPERANLRTMALSMGAKYKPDWDNSCTHLICAFANTPKFQQVRGKGKIVKKSWIHDCHSQRKCLPWRRYALDRNDQGKSESEDEISEKLDGPEPEEEQEEITDKVIELESYEKPVRNFKNEDKSASDTDDEIEKILTKQKMDEPNNNMENGEKEEEDDEFNADTDVENFEKNVKEVMESVPKIFKTEIFYIDDVFSESEKSDLERLVKAFNGTVLSRISNILDYIITNKESGNALKNRCSSAKIVSAQWIYECQEQQKLVPCAKYVLV